MDRLRDGYASSRSRYAAKLNSKFVAHSRASIVAERYAVATCETNHLKIKPSSTSACNMPEIISQLVRRPIAA